MALRVWLPLNGNINNQGLGELSVPFSVSNPVWKAGKTGANLLLENKSTNTVNVAELMGIKNLTCSFWVCLSSDKTFTTWSDICSLGIANTSSEGWYRLEIGNTTGTWLNWYGNGYVTDNSGTGGFASTPGVWYHVVTVVDNTKGYIYNYLNGNQISSKSLSTYKDNFWFTGKVRIGDTGSYITLADFRVYDECLSLKQIKEISKGLIAHYKLEGIGANANLLKGTNQGTNGWTFNVGAYYNKTVQEVLWKGVRACKFGITTGDTSSTSNWRVVEFRTQSFSKVILKPSTTYTISFDTDRKINSCTFRAGNSQHSLGDASSLPAIQLPDGTFHHAIQITTVASDHESWTYDDQFLYMQYWIPVGEFGTIANLKIEEGSINTKWIPHIEDREYTILGYNEILKNDASGNGYNLIAMDNKLSTDADVARYECSVYRSSATGPVATIPTIFGANQEVDELTLSIWWKTNNTLGSNKNLICLGNNSFIRYGVVTGGNSLWTYVRMNGTNQALNPSISSILDDKWHLYTVTFNKGILTAYKDGVQIGTKDCTDIATTLSCEDNSHNYIGSYNDTQELVNGSFSDVRIYATALAADDVLALYKTSGMIDNKGNVYAYEFKEE